MCKYDDPNGSDAESKSVRADATSNLRETQGLEYALSEDRKSYIVTGIGTARDRDIVIPAVHDGKAVIAIGKNAFVYCHRLRNIAIPNSVYSIGGSAFSDCSGLTGLTLPDSVILIGIRAFSNCSSLTNVTIPNGVTSIGGMAFHGCSSLTRIVFKGTKEEWKAIRKNSYWNNGTGIFIVQCTDGILDKNGKGIY